MTTEPQEGRDNQVSGPRAITITGDLAYGSIVKLRDATTGELIEAKKAIITLEDFERTEAILTFADDSTQWCVVERAPR